MSDENTPTISENDALEGFAYDLEFGLKSSLQESGIAGLSVIREQVANWSSHKVHNIGYKNGCEIRLVREGSFSIPFFINPLGNYTVEIFGTRNSVQPMRPGLSAQECLLAVETFECALRYFHEQTEENPPWQDETKEGQLKGFEFYFLAYTRNRFEELEIAVAERGLRERPSAIGCDDRTQRIKKVPLMHLVESGFRGNSDLAGIMERDRVWAATYKNPDMKSLRQNYGLKKIGEG